MKRNVGDTVYMDTYPYPVKAVIVKLALVEWGLHTVRREDLSFNTTASEEDFAREAYALYMREQYKEN